MAQGFRPDRLGDQIRAEISALLAREVHDPGIGFITITRVSLTSDLQIARIYYTTMATDAARKDTARALGRVTPFLRRQLAGRLRLRRVPEIEFRFDQTVEQHDRIERIIQEIHAEEAARPAPEPEAEPEAGAVPDPGTDEEPHGD
jgi:ribosome-binding factor A